MISLLGQNRPRLPTISNTCCRAVLPLSDDKRYKPTPPGNLASAKKSASLAIRSNLPLVRIYTVLQFFAARSQGFQSTAPRKKLHITKRAQKPRLVFTPTYVFSELRKGFTCKFANEGGVEKQTRSFFLSFISILWGKTRRENHFWRKQFTTGGGGTGKSFFSSGYIYIYIMKRANSVWKSSFVWKKPN